MHKANYRKQGTACALAFFSPKLESSKPYIMDPEFQSYYKEIMEIYMKMKMLTAKEQPERKPQLARG